VNAPSQPAPFTVAVVDDDSTATTLLSRILSRAGHTVVVFTSGEELLQQPSLSEVDIVCLDQGLPGIDGLETLRRLQSIRPSLPVIVFSASADAIRDEALAAGAVSCVDKTKGWEGVGAAIDSAMDHRRGS